MRLFHRMILRALPGPFLGWLGTLLFLLVMQFLIKHLPEIAGRGLPAGMIVELIAYSIAYMVVLAVPMATLLACLMAFGRLMESRAYLVIKNSGVSLLQLVWPVLAIGVLLTAFMTYFNNVILPESNFRARGIFIDIQKKRPDFELQPGVFYEGVRNYSILVRERDEPSGTLRGVLIYDYTRGSRNAVTMTARSARLESHGTSVDLFLYDGEVNRLVYASTLSSRERYERLRFDRYRLRLDLSEFTFRRTDPASNTRSDRSTPTSVMVRMVDSLEAAVAFTKQVLRDATLQLATADSAQGPLPAPAELDSLPPPVPRVALAGLSRREGRQVYEHAVEGARAARRDVERLGHRLEREARWADQYRVEIYKKYAIALTCLIFALIGAPLGLSMRSGGLGKSAVIALGLFLFYWVSLVQGEKLADRGFLSPWLGMWVADIILGLVGMGLFVYLALDLGTTRRLQRPAR